jgi:hypothetical protein
MPLVWNARKASRQVEATYAASFRSRKAAWVPVDAGANAQLQNCLELNLVGQTFQLPFKSGNWCPHFHNRMVASGPASPAATVSPFLGKFFAPLQAHPIVVHCRMTFTAPSSRRPMPGHFCLVE